MLIVSAIQMMFRRGDPAGRPVVALFPSPVESLGEDMFAFELRGLTLTPPQPLPLRNEGLY